jgi:AcrR family transcriptional regulator
MFLVEREHDMKTTATLPKSEATIAKILAAAETLFVERNYAEVTMDQIAAASDVTKGGLYHHFAGKEELYLAMMHRDLSTKRALFTSAIDTGTGCRDKLRRLTRTFFELPRAKRRVMRLVRRDANIFPSAIRRELIRAYQEALPKLAESVIKEGIASGELASVDPMLLSWHFVAMVEVTLSRPADTLFPDIETKLDYLMNLFFHGAARGPRDQTES